MADITATSPNINALLKKIRETLQAMRDQDETHQKRLLTLLEVVFDEEAPE